MDQHTENHITNCTDVYKLSRPTVIIIQCWYICLSEICGHNLKNVGRRAVVLMLSLLSLQQLFCPTFLRFWPHISESDPPWKKTAHMGLKNYGMVPKKILWPRHMYKWYILKKNWQKSVNSTLSTGEKKVPVGIWGCHHQLDNHHK